MMDTRTGDIISWDEATALQTELAEPVVTNFVGYALGHLANYYANRAKPTADFDAAFFAAVAAEMARNKELVFRILRGDVDGGDVQRA